MKEQAISMLVVLLGLTFAVWLGLAPVGSTL